MKKPYLVVLMVCLAGIVLAILAREPSAGLPQPAGTLAFLDTTVIPMHREVLLENQTVVVRDGRITEVGPAAAVVVPDEAKVIDGRGRFLVPGLADMHAHLRRKKGHRPEDNLREGVTLVRNMQGDADHLKFRELARSGTHPVPMFYTAGQALAGQRIDRRHRIVTTPEEGRAAVREQVAAGYDFIKVYSFLSLEVYDAILLEAAEHGIPVVGHVPDAVKAIHAIESGQSTIEHGYGYFWELESASSEILGTWKPRRLFHAVTIDEDKLTAIAAKTAAAGVWNCPTVWRKDNFLTAPIVEEEWAVPALRRLGEENRRKLVKALHDAGAGLLIGTDDRAEIIHEELAIFVESGLTPYEALRAATVNPAEYLGELDDFGTLEVGRRANILVLDENPLQDIRNTRSIVGVAVNGIWIPR